MFQIAGHTMGTPEYTLPEALELFHKLGLDGAEIVVQDGYRCGIPQDADPDKLKELRKLADRLGLRIIALTPYYSKFNDLDPTVREGEIQGICKVIGYAEILGAKYIRIYAGNYAQTDTDPDGAKRANLVRSMRRLGDAAQKANVKLVMENHFNTMTVSAADSISIAREIDHPAVGILYDQANLTFTENEPWEEALPLQFSKIYHTHVKDLVFRAGNTGFTSSDVSHPKEEERNVITRIVGEGIVPWPAILQAMKDRGYDGWLSLEYERRWHPQDIPDAAIGMKQSAAYLRACIEKLTWVKRSRDLDQILRRKE